MAATTPGAAKNLDMGSELLTKSQFRDALERLGLTQGQAAKALHLSLNMVNHYANGRYPVPFLVAEVLRLWLKTGLPRAN